MQNVKIRLLNDKAKIPIKATEGSACFDVVATSKEILNGGYIIKYGTGLSMEIPKGYQIDCRARSSIWKTGLILSNSIGTIDSDYRGEIMAVFYNVVPGMLDYEIGDRIMQIQLVKTTDNSFEEVDVLSDTERGTGGFGSTGK